LTERVVGLLGRTPAIHPVGYRLIDSYVDALPQSPPVFDHTGGFDGFRMLGNGPDPTLHVHDGRPVGDCAFVGTQAVTICDQIETGEPLTWASSDELVSTYLAYNRGRDIGANLSQLLAYWHTVGLPWAGKCAGYAALNFRDLDGFWAGVNAFGNGYLGIVVTAAMQAQTQAGEPWDLTGLPLERQVMGGHCVVAIARTSEEGDGEVATWGMRQPFTAKWFRANVEEAHVVLTPSQVARKGNGYGLTLPELQSDLSAVNSQALAA